jgi:hypothetical protein
MNTPSKDLFNLIRSLSMNEKLNFKKFSSIHTGSEDKNYLKLYEEIEKQARTGDEYNEEKIKEKFKGEKFVKQLHVTKSYLYDLILKSLVLHHSHASDLSELYAIINSIHQLYERGLFSHCEKLLKKGKKIAYENEYFQELLRLLNYEQMVEAEYFSSVNAKSKKYESTGTFSEVRKVTETINNYQDYIRLSRRVDIILHKNLNAAEISEFKNIIKDPLLKNESKAFSYKAKMVYYIIKERYYGETGDAEKHFELTKEHFEFMESHPERIRKNMLQYISVLYDILVTCAKNNQVKEHGKYLEKVKELYEAKEDRSLKELRHDIYDVYLIHLLLRAFLTGELQKEAGTVKILESDFLLHQNKIPEKTRFNIYYLLSEFYFMLNDYKKALYYINIIINYKETGEILELYILSACLNLLIHYELKNFETVESLSRSVHYFLKKNNKLNRSNSNFLKLLKELLSAASKKEEVSAFNKFIDDEEYNAQDSNEDYLKFSHVLKPWIKLKIAK